MITMEKLLSDAFLNDMRDKCDDKADEAVSRLSKHDVKAANALMPLLITNEQPLPGQLHESLKSFFNETASLPDWADRSLILEGQRFFNRAAPQMLLALFCASLPSCYAASKGVKVLHRTGKMGREHSGRARDGFYTGIFKNLLTGLPMGPLAGLSHRVLVPWVERFMGAVRLLGFSSEEPLPTNLQRRIMETAQMVVDVMAPKQRETPAGLEPGGHGIRSAQKVRLMHAVVRRLIAREGGWNPAWGQPINQEDMAATMLAFSVIPLQALPELGCDPSPHEREAYYHAWRVVGHIMGIEAELLPERCEDGEALFAKFKERHFRPSKEGAEMTDALLTLLDHVTPGNLFDDLGEVLMHYLLGDDTAKAAGVPLKYDLRRILRKSPLVALKWATEDTAEDDLFNQEVCTLLGRKLMDGIVWAGRGKDRVPFRLPDQLRERWEIQGWQKAPKPKLKKATA